MDKAPQKAKKTKKQRKHRRNVLTCARYRNQGRREKNKLKRLRKHIARHPGDKCAIACVARGGLSTGAPKLDYRPREKITVTVKKQGAKR